jgi:hypothetical protein
MDCSLLNEAFNCNGPEWIDDSNIKPISKGWKHHPSTIELIRKSNKGISQSCRDAHKKRRENNMWKVWNKGVMGAGKGLGVKRVEYRGMEFPSMTSAAEYFNVTVSAVSQRCVRVGLDITS